MWSGFFTVWYFIIHMTWPQLVEEKKKKKGETAGEKVEFKQILELDLLQTRGAVHMQSTSVPVLIRLETINFNTFYLTT